MVAALAAAEVAIVVDAPEAVDTHKAAATEPPAAAKAIEQAPSLRKPPTAKPKRRQAEQQLIKASPSKRYLTRMGAMEQDVSFARREIECLRMEFDAEVQRLRAELHRCMAAMPQRGVLEDDALEEGGDYMLITRGVLEHGAQEEGGGEYMLMPPNYSVPFEQLPAVAAVSAHCFSFSEQ